MMLGARETRRDYTEDYRRMGICFHLVSTQIMAHQSPTTGLYPVSTDPNSKCKEAHVRDSIYCATTCWALHLAYRRMSDDGGKAHLLGQSAVKTMRGILQCWMRQSQKLSDFIIKQSLGSELHSKFHLDTGEELCDENYPHLQMDCVSLYILTLLQMIQSGLKIIFNHIEVAFIQNLLFYLERNYRIADFGMWERGTKQNNGTPELNASSVGLTKAVLEAANGANLYGTDGASWSVTFTDADAHMRNRVIFESMIPRESRSKNADAALLPAISWPAFALHDPKIKGNCLDHIKKNLLGDYGLKRFQQDGCGTQLEDKNRQHYLATEISLFQGIESQWPFLLYYLVINYIYDNDPEGANRVYAQADELLQKSSTGDPLVVRYYYVAEKLHRAGDSAPSLVYAMCKEASEGTVYLWGQALYLIARMLVEGVLSPRELDPLNRGCSVEGPRWSHRYTTYVPYVPDQVVQVAVIAETVRLQQVLSTYGIRSQTPSQVHPIQIWSPNELKKAYALLGVSKRVAIKGRPARPIGCLGTSKVFRVNGVTVLSYPLLFEISDFYLSQDIGFVVNEVQYNLSTISRMWKLSGKPTYTILLREELIASPNAKELINLLSAMKAGVTPLGTKVKLIRVQNMLTSVSIEHLDFLKATNLDTECPFFRKLTEPKELASNLGSINFNLNVRRVHKHFSKAIDMGEYSDEKLVSVYLSEKDLPVQCWALRELRSRHGPEHRIATNGGAEESTKDMETIDACLSKIRRVAGRAQDWSVVRLCSGICGQMVDSLAPSIMTIIVSGKQMSLGSFGHQEVAFDRPLSPAEVEKLLYEVSARSDQRQATLHQEMILGLGKLCETAQGLFGDIHKIRVGWIVQAMIQELEQTSSPCIFSLSPSEVFNLLVKVLSTDSSRNMGRRRGRFSSGPPRTVLGSRRLDGYLSRVPVQFYERVWQILVRAPCGLAVKGRVLKRTPALTDLERDDVAFRSAVEDVLAPLDDPLYRQISVETLMIVGTILERNPEVGFTAEVRVEAILEAALAHYSHGGGRSLMTPTDLWQSFCAQPPGGEAGTCTFIARATFDELFKGNMGVQKGDCSVM